MSDWNQRLKKARTDKKLSLKDVTKQINISQQSLIEYEKGNVYPKLDMLVLLCDLYDVSPNYIIYGNSSGLKLDNNIQREMEILISLYINNKIKYNKNDNSITFVDKFLKKYFNYFIFFLEEHSKNDLIEIEKIIHAINNLKE